MYFKLLCNLAFPHRGRLRSRSKYCTYSFPCGTRAPASTQRSKFEIPRTQKSRAYASTVFYLVLFGLVQFLLHRSWCCSRRKFYSKPRYRLVGGSSVDGETRMSTGAYYREETPCGRSPDDLTEELLAIGGCTGTCPCLDLGPFVPRDPSIVNEAMCGRKRRRAGQSKSAK